jgi:tetratricopeptide (TPR) repeat protein
MRTKRHSHTLFILSVLIWIGCQQPPTNEFENRQAFLDQFKSKGNFGEALPFRSIDSIIAFIRAEVPDPWKGHTLAIAYHRRIVDIQPDSVALIYLNRIEQEFPHDSITAFAELQRGQHYLNTKLDYKAAAACYTHCYNLSIKGNRLADAFDAEHQYGIMLVQQGAYDEGIKKMIATYEYYQTMYNDGGRCYEVTRSIARAYRDNMDYETALKWYKQMLSRSLKYFYPPHQVFAYSYLGRTYGFLNQLDSAKIMIDSAEYVCKNYTVLPGSDNFVRYNRADVYRRMGRCAEALADLKMAAPDVLFAAPDAKARVNNIFGDIYLCLNQMDSAEVYYRRALTAPDTRFLAFAHESLSNFYQKKGDLAQALDYKNKSIDLRNHIVTAKKERELAWIQIKNETEKRFRDLENAQEQKRLWLAIGLSAAVVGLLVAAYSLVRSRYRQRKLLKRNELAEAQAALKTQALQQVEAVVISQNKEIEDIKQQLDFRNEVIEKLRMIMDATEENSPNPTILPNKTPQNDKGNAASSDQQSDPTDNPDASKESFKNIRILTKADWKHFRELYDARYPNFSHQLRAQLPDLTPAEIRLFLLIKTGFDIDEISNVLGISTTSVYMSRYRLRKKLGIAEEDDLERWVQEF